MPDVVTAGVPTRIPGWCTIGLRVSNGIVFLLTVIQARSSDSWASLPVSPVAVRSISIRWVSVPPLTSRYRADQRVGQRLRRRSAAVRAPVGREGLPERDRLGRDDVHERPALHPRHHDLVEGLGVRRAAR
jgi:hypothetical protein